MPRDPYALREEQRWRTKSYSKQSSVPGIQAASDQKLKRNRTKTPEKPSCEQSSDFRMELRPFTGGRTASQQLLPANLTATCKRMRVDPFLTPHPSISTRRSKDLSVRLKNINLKKARQNVSALDLERFPGCDTESDSLKNFLHQDEKMLSSWAW